MPPAIIIIIIITIIIIIIIIINKPCAYSALELNMPKPRSSTQTGNR